MFFLMAAVDVVGIIALAPVLAKAYSGRKYQEFRVENSEGEMD